MAVNMASFNAKALFITFLNDKQKHKSYDSKENLNTWNMEFSCNIRLFAFHLSINSIIMC